MLLLIQIAGLIVLSQGLIISAFVLNIYFQLASSDTVESEGRQMKHCWTKYIKNIQTSPLLLYNFAEDSLCFL